METDSLLRQKRILVKRSEGTPRSKREAGQAGCRKLGPGAVSETRS